MSKEEILGKIIGIIYRIYSSSFRYRFVYEDHLAKEGIVQLLSKTPDINKCLLVATWHQDELAVIPCFKSGQATIMVSKSKDGTILAGALSIFGYRTVRGSSTRAGVGAFMGALRVIKSGYNMAFACDGPKGPIYKTKEGIIKISDACKRPILPMRLHPHHAYTFYKSWSHSRLPLPFSKIIVFVGRPDFYSKEQLDSKLQALSLLQQDS